MLFLIQLFDRYLIFRVMHPTKCCLEIDISSADLAECLKPASSFIDLVCDEAHRFELQVLVDRIEVELLIITL